MRCLIIFIIMFATTVCSGQLRADLNHDGIVNLEDFAIMAEEWLQEETVANYKVTGTLVPDATGDYVLAGTYAGKNYYNRTDGLYSLWWLEDGSSWFITVGVGVPGVGSFARADTEIVGEYSPQAAYAGTATVTEIRATEFSESSIKPSLSQKVWSRF